MPGYLVGGAPPGEDLGPRRVNRAQVGAGSHAAIEIERAAGPGLGVLLPLTGSQEPDVVIQGIGLVKLLARGIGDGGGGCGIIRAPIAVTCRRGTVLIDFRSSELTLITVGSRNMGRRRHWIVNETRVTSVWIDDHYQQ